VNLHRTVVFLAIGVLFLAYAATLPIVLWGDGRESLGPSQLTDYLVLVGGFGASLGAAFYHVCLGWPPIQVGA